MDIPGEKACDHVWKRVEDILDIGSVKDFWNSVRQIWIDGIGGVDVPRMAIALAILVAALILRRPVASLVLRLLRRALRGKDAAIAVVDAMHPPAQVLAPLIGLVIVNEFVLDKARLQVIGRDLARTLVVLALFWAIYLAVAPLLRRLERRSGMINASMLGVAVAGLHVVVLALGAAAILDVWGIKVGPILAGFGLVGAAVALGAQDVFKNLIGGIFIIIEDRFQNGDWIASDGVCEGTVEAIGLRTTRVRQFDLSPIYVPNAQLSDTAVVNYSRMTYRRISWTVGLTYDTDLAALKQVRDGLDAYIRGCADFVDNADAPVFVRVDDLGDSAINMMVYCFTKSTDWGEWLAVKERLAVKIVEIAAGAGAGLAFPSQSLYVETLPKGTDLFAPKDPAAPPPAG
jgi:MscS family membrane protein